MEGHRSDYPPKIKISGEKISSGQTSIEVKGLDRKLTFQILPSSGKAAIIIILENIRSHQVAPLSLVSTSNLYIGILISTTEFWLLIMCTAALYMPAMLKVV